MVNVTGKAIHLYDTRTVLVSRSNIKIDVTDTSVCLKIMNFGTIFVDEMRLKHAMYHI